MASVFQKNAVQVDTFEVGNDVIATLDVGSYSISGAAVNTVAARKLALAGGTLSISGAALSTQRSRNTIAASGTYTLTGAAMTPRRANATQFLGGTYSIAAGTLDFFKITTKTVIASQGTYAVNGAALNFKRSRVSPTLNSSYFVTGAPVTLRYGIAGFRPAAFQSTAFQMAGAATDIILDPSSGYAITGASVNLAWKTSRFIIPAGAYSLSGATVRLAPARKLGTSNGSYAISGSILYLRKPLRVGYVWVYTGSDWVEKPLKLWNGSAWETQNVKYYDGIWRLA